MLGAGVLPRGLPSPALLSRTLLALELYDQGYASHLIFTGGLGANPPAEAEVMRQVAIAQGVPPQSVVVEDQGRNTRDSATRVAGICARYGWSSLLLVSDRFHLVRARVLFRDLGFTASTASTRDPCRGGHHRVRYVLRETMALLSYCLYRSLPHSLP